jgi:hypothetical protein
MTTGSSPAAIGSEVATRVADDDLETEVLFGEGLHVAAHVRHPCWRRRRDNE